MTKRYKVIGAQPILDGHLPGSTFEADLPEDQEAFLKQIGAIKSVGGPAPKDPEAGVEAVAEERFSKQKPVTIAPRQRQAA